MATNTSTAASNRCDSARPIERLRHARLNWLGSLSRHLLSERAKLLVLRRKHVELLAHLRGRQFDKLRRGLHTQQLMSVVKGGASVGTCNLDQLEIVVGGALGNSRIGILEQVGCFLAGCLRLGVGVLGMRDAFLGHLTK